MMRITRRDIKIELEPPLSLSNDDALALLAHDIRSSITVITGFAKTLRDRDDALTATDRMVGLGAIIRHGDLIKRFAEDLIDIARAESDRLELKREMIALGALVAGTVARVRNDHPTHTFTVRILAAGACVNADPARIEQVLMNLLGNAARCSPSDTDIQVLVTRSATNVSVMVHDHGPGFTDDQLPLLFKKFTPMSRSGEGLGLGLYLCRLIVEAHGGVVWARSGSGATIGFRLPAAAAPRVVL
jgi:K+-sensing histidine kinase KdpD